MVSVAKLDHATVPAAYPCKHGQGRATRADEVKAISFAQANQ